VSRYALETLLGSGGMAEVYRARQHGAEGVARPVALKRIAPALSRDPEFAKLFVAEARIAALLQHPNIVSIVDFDRDADGCLFLAMELVDGADLRTLVGAARARGERVAPELTAFLVAEVLRALAHAHDFAPDGKPLGIVHRDVSPHNVLISRAGAVKLADFGIAKATAATGAALSTTIKGKVSYMAPEQARGEVIDARADLFAVGVMLYELLAGERPFDGATESEILARLLMHQHAPLAERAPHAPRELVAVAERLMAPRAADRFASAHAAREALTAWRGYPVDGVGLVAAWARRLLPEPSARMAVSPPAAVGTPKPDTMAAAPTRMRFAPGPRTLAILATLAALSVTAAVLVWLPRARHARPEEARTPQAPPPAAIGSPAVVDAGVPAPAFDPPSSASTAPKKATGGVEPPASPAPVPAPDAAPAPEPRDSPPKRRGDEWRVNPKQPSPDVVPLDQ
jgi:serine/threonine-protein kinase